MHNVTVEKRDGIEYVTRKMDLALCQGRSWRKLHYTTLRIAEGSELYDKWLKAPMVLYQENTPEDYFYEMDLMGAQSDQHTTLNQPYDSSNNNSEWEEECFMFATSDPWSTSTVPEKEELWEEDLEGEVEDG